MFNQLPLGVWASRLRAGCPLVLLSAGISLSGEPARPSAPVLNPENLSLQNEAQRGIDRGVAWLQSHQTPEGYWSTPDHPAITGLVLMALRGAPQPPADETFRQALTRGDSYLLASVQPDGGIYRKPQLHNYNTAISIMALLAADRSEYTPVILQARRFLKGLQSDFGVPGKLDHAFDGGIGYGSRYRHSDLSNTMHALEAIYYSRQLIRDQPVPEADRLNWKAALRFVQRCQNLPSHNPEAWASDDPDNHGGFVYFPGNSQAGEMTLPSGRKALRSYGSISYAGLLSYSYAGLTAEDPRVAAVLKWLRENYTLTENPGLGPQGLFFYYHTMAKALTAAGVDRLEIREGQRVSWRQELLMQLLARQREDGSWINQHPRWWENDPALVTAYATITLSMIHRGL